MVDKFLPKLSQNLLEILDDDEYYDITIEVGNDPNVKVFRAHMVVLYYRSSYLRRILSINKNKNDGILTHIKLPNISPEIFQIILRYIYGGRLSLERMDTTDIIKVLFAANELNLQELITYLQSILIENTANWTGQNFYLMCRKSFENNSFLELQKYCTDLILKEPEEKFNSPNFSSIPEKLLVSIIQNDNFQMSDIQIWGHVLKWGIAQNPELPSDVINYSKEDFNILMNTLQQCIPFIRFYYLTSKEFMDKVYPYRKVLPKELRNKLIKMFLNLSNPDNKPIKEIDSKIITYQYAELISKWINRLEITDKLISSYEFKLLYRGSRDGITRDKFHKMCDDRSRTVTIIKVKDSNEILGGYNPIAWKSDYGFCSTKDSFIFSFNSNDRIENYILSRVMNEKNAIFNGSLSFGKGDLDVWGPCNYNYCSKNSYEKPIRNNRNRFAIEECEVFQIVRHRCFQ